ncbi:MAG: hypothetical protein M3R54_13635 [Chloroflexota bacterium]|nr:hypothetical protein [Chloroflexota bacterium]
MDPQILRAGFRIGFLVLALAVLMLPFQPRDSAEFVVTVLAALVGGAFVFGVALVARSANPPLPGAKGQRKDYNKRSTGRDSDHG